MGDFQDAPGDVGRPGIGVDVRQGLLVRTRLGQIDVVLDDAAVDGVKRRAIAHREGVKLRRCVGDVAAAGEVGRGGGQAGGWRGQAAHALVEAIEVKHTAAGGGQVAGADVAQGVVHRAENIDRARPQPALAGQGASAVGIGTRDGDGIEALLGERAGAADGALDFKQHTGEGIAQRYKDRRRHSVVETIDATGDGLAKEGVADELEAIAGADRAIDRALGGIRLCNVGILVEEAFDRAAVHLDGGSAGALVVGNLQCAGTEVDRACAAARAVCGPAFDGARQIGRCSSVAHRIDVEGTVTLHRDGAAAQCIDVEDLQSTLLNAHVAGVSTVNRAVRRRAADGGIPADIERTGPPLGQAGGAGEGGHGDAGAGAFRDVAAVADVDLNAAIAEAWRIRQRQHAGFENAALAAAGVGDLQNGIKGSAAGGLHLDVIDRLGAVVGPWIPGNHGIVERDDTARSVGVVERVALVQAEVQLRRAGGAAIEGDRVRIGDGAGIAQGAKGTKGQLAFIDHPALVVAVAGAACGIALVLGDGEDARAELGDAVGGDVAAEGDGRRVVDGQFKLADGAGLEVRLHRRGSVEEQATTSGIGAHGEGIELARAIADAVVGAQRVDHGVVQQGGRGGQTDTIRTSDGACRKERKGVRGIDEASGTVGDELVAGAVNDIGGSHAVRERRLLADGGDDELLGQGSARGGSEQRSRTGLEDQGGTGGTGEVARNGESDMRIGCGRGGDDPGSAVEAEIREGLTAGRGETRACIREGRTIEVDGTATPDIGGVATGGGGGGVADGDRRTRMDGDRVAALVEQTSQARSARSRRGDGG